MNAEFLKSAIDAFKNFVAACGNDVANDGGEYVVFSGQISADSKGNVKTYALVNDPTDNESTEPKKILVAQAPLRAILDRGADFGKTLVDLYEANKKESEAKAEEEAQAEADKAANEEIDTKITDLQSEIELLKQKKRPVRRLVKKQPFQFSED